MGKLRENLRKQQGEIMLEASLVLVAVLLLLLVLLGLSFCFYQQSLMNTVAHEIASDVARNLKYTNLPVGVEEISLTDATSTHMFRMSFGQGTVAQAQADRGEEYAQWRVPEASLGLNPGTLHVECEVSYTGIGRARVRVKVFQETDFFLSSVLEMVGVTKDRQLFSATAYAECMDLMAYTSMVNFTVYAAGVLDAFDSVGKLYSSVKEWAEKLM